MLQTVFHRPPADNLTVRRAVEAGGGLYIAVDTPDYVRCYLPSHAGCKCRDDVTPSWGRLRRLAPTASRSREHSC